MARRARPQEKQSQPRQGSNSSCDSSSASKTCRCGKSMPSLQHPPFLPKHRFPVCNHARTAGAPHHSPDARLVHRAHTRP